jgi:biopolymer transport protein ExbD
VAAATTTCPSHNGDEGPNGLVSFDDGEEVNREAEMDMTPLVDVTFLLLIFFMVTAAFTLQKSIELPVPVADLASPDIPDDDDENEAVTIQIDADNMYTVTTADDEYECPSVQELYVRLRDAMSATPRPERLIVRASGEATHERVVKAIDAGTEVGLGEIQLTTVDEDF